MEADLKEEVQELKTSIDRLSDKVYQQFSELNENFYTGINQLSKQIANLSEAIILNNNLINENLDTSKQNISPKPLKTSKIPEDYFINYSYITNDAKYRVWLDKLQKYSKTMAECRQNEQFLNFCRSAHQTLESSIQLLFTEEFKYIDESNINFLKAYDRVRKYFEKKGYKLPPDIYISNEVMQINSEQYKQFGNSYISWQNLEEMRRLNFTGSARILFEVIKPNFYDIDINLRKKYLTVQDINSLRSFASHGSKDSDDEQINKLHERTKKLLESKENFLTIKDVVDWFVKEVYSRVNKIAN